MGNGYGVCSNLASSDEHPPLLHTTTLTTAVLTRCARRLRTLQIVSMLSVFFIVVSILTFCLKTHPSMRVPVIHNATVFARSSQPVYVVAPGRLPSPLPPSPYKPHANGTTRHDDWTVRPLKWMLEKRKTQPHDAFFMIESVCNAWFTFELAIRSVINQSIHQSVSLRPTSVFRITIRNTLVGRLRQRSAYGRLQAKPKRLCFFCNTCNAP